MYDVLHVALDMSYPHSLRFAPRSLELTMPSRGAGRRKLFAKQLGMGVSVGRSGSTLPSLKQSWKLSSQPTLVEENGSFTTPGFRDDVD